MAKMGRPKKEVDFETIDKLCALQCLEQEIADFLGLSVDTIYRACLKNFGITFAEYFKQKRGHGKVALRRAQWQTAQAGNPALLIWLGKQYLDQKDKSTHELSGIDGKPITTKTEISDEQLSERIREYTLRLNLGIID